MIANDRFSPQNPAEESDPHATLTPRQERAIVALLNEQTIGRAAAAAKVPERTL